MVRKKNCNLILFLIGGLSYGIIEILWRKYTHWTMIITGGTCFVILYRLFIKLVDISLWKKCLLGSGIITVIEFISGCIVNIWCKMDVWDYSSLPANIFGQICGLYTILWGFLSIPIVWICNLINKKLKL